MASTTESVLGPDDLDTSSIDGFGSTYNSGSEVEGPTTEGTYSLNKVPLPTKTKRLGKLRRKRLQKKMAKLALDPILEEQASSVVITPKRMRAASGITPEAAAKRPRTFAQTVVSSTVKKFCVRENNQNISLNDEKLQLFRGEIGRRILDAARSSGFVPQMLACYLADNVFICKCSNEETFKWFSAEILKITDIWEGCQLSVGDPPKPLLVHTWVPGNENPNVVTTNIGLMNPQVSTKEWKVVRHKREASRQSIVYRVDRKSFDDITGSGLTMQYILEKILFRVISGK